MASSPSHAQRLLLAVDVEELHRHHGGAVHVLGLAGDGQAALGVGRLALQRDDLRVDHRQRLGLGLARAGVQDDDALEDAHLRRGEPHAVGGVHRLEHVLDQGADGVVHLRHGPGLLLQDGIGPDEDLANHGAPLNLAGADGQPPAPAPCLSATARATAVSPAGCGRTPRAAGHPPAPARPR